MDDTAELLCELAVFGVACVAAFVLWLLVRRWLP